MRKAGNSSTEQIEVLPIDVNKMTVCILGSTPLIYSAMSHKTVGVLLCPPPRKTSAEKAVTLKHNPMEEYLESTYRRRQNVAGPTRLLARSEWFKAGMADVAKRVPGTATTAAVKQLVWVQGDYVDLYGIPQLLMSVVRNSDMNRTPDVRTRAIVPQWACTLSVTYVKPHLTQDAVARLLVSAGILNGVGDWRAQKGSGSYGQFEVVSETDPRFRALAKNGGMRAQDQALKNPQSYDQETEELLSWFNDELKRREREPREVRVRASKKDNGRANADV
jgi:hypothetical protein